MAVCHLIDNACKFSPQNGVIQVHLESNIFGGCILTIQDQGPGIPTSMREMVFERFYQISNEMELPENQGMGLGLYLVRSFARSRGGDVRFLDTFTGCCVEMTLRHK
jgi:two-component system sensor histidine kinase QseC